MLCLQLSTWFAHERIHAGYSYLKEYAHSWTAPLCVSRLGADTNLKIEQCHYHTFPFIVRFCEGAWLAVS